MKVEPTTKKLIEMLYDRHPEIFHKPKLSWVGLTDDQFLEAARLAEDGNYLVAFQRIQQWLKEGNT